MAYIEMKHSYKRQPSGETDIIANKDVTLKLKGANWSSFWGHCGRKINSPQYFGSVWIPMMKGRF